MSFSEEVYIERANRRRELYEARIRENVQEHLERYASVLADMKAQGLDTAVQDTFSHAEIIMRQAQDMVDSNVEQAQAFSFELGDLVRGLPSYARARKREAAAADREAARREAAADREAARREAYAEELRRAREHLSAEAEQARGTAAEALRALVARVDASLAASDEPTAAPKAEETLRQVEKAKAEIAVDEAMRRETMRALSETMHRLGFAAEAPVRQNQWVRLRFRNLAGEQALFLVGGDGAMKYSFSGYHGAACKKDRERVRTQLADIYGVKFSEERIIQENPDSIEKSSVSRSRPENAG